MVKHEIYQFFQQKWPILQPSNEAFFHQILLFTIIVPNFCSHMKVPLNATKLIILETNKLVSKCYK